MTKVYKRWEIWWVDQNWSRANTIPVVPGDHTKCYRMYLLTGNQTQLDTGNEFTCVPVKTEGDKDLAWHIALNTHDGGVRHPCFIWTNQIYTLPEEAFDNKVGDLPQPFVERVLTSTAEFFKIKSRHVV